ncbi:MAG: FAD/NAD(P)-binding protein [Proteobacteria bacterium]|nr:FAD/NAD(P)-binding protein [Pseudomonadota bacterium]MBU1687045.1 FAD/NAD(P)-binding protein [Pseudomonadota bacterium]
MEHNAAGLYLPKTAKVQSVIEENSQIKTFALSLSMGAQPTVFRFQPGQFVMVSMPHCGEAPISIASSNSRTDSFDLSVRLAGRLTSAMHSLQPGDSVGIRGPFGRPFPLDKLVGTDLLFIAGGIGLAPLRSVILSCLADPRFSDNRITLLYGSRSPADIAFCTDLAAWEKSGRVDCHLTVDHGTPDWKGSVGLVTSLLDTVAPNPTRTKALVCGPGLMIRAVLAELTCLGFDPNDIITTLERHMKCGVGVCRHCHLDDKLVCRDGPVFTLAELQGHEVMELAT